MINFEENLEIFCINKVLPYAKEFDQNDDISKQAILDLFSLGYFEGIAGEKYNYDTWSNVDIGLTNKVIGKYSPALRTLLTVHGMALISLKRWGRKQLKNEYINRMASGDYICSFALSEPLAGSDANSIQTSAELVDDYYIVNGTKDWISFSNIANGFLTFVLVDNQPTCMLIDSDVEGLVIEKLSSMSANRGTGMGRLKFNNCKVPKENIVGGVGNGINLVALYALDFGRFTVSWGALGIASRCLELTADRVKNRVQFGKALEAHDLVKKIMTEMIVSVKNMELLSFSAAKLRDSKSLDSIFESWCAKYYNSKMCVEISSNAQQLFGGVGFLSDLEINRLHRESKVLEVIEGTTQIHELVIAEEYMKKFANHSV